MSNLVKHAERELGRLLNGKVDEMQIEMNKCILEVVEVFSKQGHSGMSASYAVAVLNKLLSFEPLGPLTGEDDEWVVLDYADDMVAQNNRCFHVFKRKDGTAYNSEAVIFREPNGACYTNFESRRDITFPYTPTVEYVDVPASEEVR